MPIAIVCSSCGAKANAPDSAAGKKVKCPKCQTAIVVPLPAPPVDELDEEPMPPPIPRSSTKGGALVPRKAEDDDLGDEEYEDEPSGKAGQLPANAPNKTVLGIVAILFGAFGVHKFMLGNTNAGLIMLLVSVLSVCTLWPFMLSLGYIEGIIYLAKSEEDFYQTYVVNKRAWL